MSSKKIEEQISENSDNNKDDKYANLLFESVSMLSILERFLNKMLIKFP
jgi:hypothetical protein